MKPYRSSCLILSVVVLLSVLGSAAPTQMLESRISTIERRLDQIQSRVDSVEREQRMSSIGGAARSDVSQATVLELQRQQNNLAQELVLIEQKILEVNKALDALRSEKRDEAKPKVTEPPKKKN
jgi:prefoldin subunit 5